MKRLVQFPLEEKEGSASIWVEVDEPDSDVGTMRVARGGEVVETARTTFQQAIDQIKPGIDALGQKLNDLNHPTEVGVEFGLKLSARAGMVLASADSEVTFKVILKWKNP